MMRMEGSYRSALTRIQCRRGFLGVGEHNNKGGWGGGGGGGGGQLCGITGTPGYAMLYRIDMFPLMKYMCSTQGLPLN